MKFSLAVLLSMFMCLCFSGTPIFAQDEGVEIVDEAPSPDDGEAAAAEIQDSASDGTADAVPAPMPMDGGAIPMDGGIPMGGVIQGDCGCGVYQQPYPYYYQSGCYGIPSASMSYPMGSYPITSGISYNPVPMAGNTMPISTGVSMPMPAPSIIDANFSPSVSAAAMAAPSIVDANFGASYNACGGCGSYHGDCCHRGCCHRRIFPIFHRPIFGGCGCRGGFFRRGCCR